MSNNSIVWETPTSPLDKLVGDTQDVKWEDSPLDKLISTPDTVRPTNQ